MSGEMLINCENVYIIKEKLIFCKMETISLLQYIFTFISRIHPVHCSLCWFYYSRKHIPLILNGMKCLATG